MITNTMMKKPRIKRFYQVFKIAGDARIYIGVGPDKIAIDEPTAEMEEFLKNLNGSLSLEELQQRYPRTDEWLSTLNEFHVLEDRSVTPPLPEKIARRWDRQIAYLQLFDRKDWSGWEAQEKLSQAKVFVGGIGAGGSTLLRLLSAVGIGTLEAIDFDTFSLDNLPTHTTLDENDIGCLKTETLKKHLDRQNSNLKFTAHQKQIESKEELADLIAGADFFLQAFDRPRLTAARWASWAALKTNVPLASIGANDKGARVGPIIIPHQTCCDNCIGIYDQVWLQPSETAALMGTTVTLLASIMVNEIVKHITGACPSVLIGRSLYINTETLEFTFQDHPKRPDCELCSEK